MLLIAKNGSKGRSIGRCDHDHYDRTTDSFVPMYHVRIVAEKGHHKRGDIVQWAEGQFARVEELEDLIDD